MLYQEVPKDDPSISSTLTMMNYKVFRKVSRYAHSGLRHAVRRMCQTNFPFQMGYVTVPLAPRVEGRNERINRGNWQSEFLPGPELEQIRISCCHGAEQVGLAWSDLALRCRIMDDDG